MPRSSAPSPRRAIAVECIGPVEPGKRGRPPGGGREGTRSTLLLSTAARERLDAIPRPERGEFASAAIEGRVADGVAELVDSLRSAYTEACTRGDLGPHYLLGWARATLERYVS